MKRRQFLLGTAAGLVFPTVVLGNTYVTPDQFAGANITEKINNMAAQAPIGAIGWVPGGITLNRTSGQDYGVLDTGRISWTSDSNMRNPIEFGSDFAGAKVWKIRPEPPIYAALGREIANLHFNPIGVQSLTWSPTDPRCSYTGRVISMEYPDGHGEGMLWVHDIYAPFGSEAAIVIEGNDGNASVFRSVFDRIYCDGGFVIKGNPGGFGDSITMNDLSLHGKFGLDYSGMLGAGECVVNGINCGVLGGPAIKVRRGNKVRITRMNIEQKGWVDSLFGTTRRVVDISADELPKGAMLNKLEIDGTVNNQAGVNFNHVIYINHALMPRQYGLNLYANSGATVGIEYGPDCLYPMIVQPATFGISSTFGTKAIVPRETKPYGWRITPAVWNDGFNIPFNQTGENVHLIKSLDGTVTFSGVFQTNGATVITPGYGVCAVPEGFGADKETAFRIMSDTGPCTLVVSPRTSLSNGWMSLEDIPTGASRFRGSCLWHNYDHLQGINTDN